MPAAAAGAGRSGRRTGGGQRCQIDLDPRQCAIQPLKRKRRHIDIARRDNHRAAIQHQVRPALLHDRLQDRVERNLNLARGLIEARLDLSLTLLDLGLESLLLGGEVFLFLGADIGGHDRHLLLKLSGLGLKLPLFGPQLGFKLLRKRLCLGEDVLPRSRALEKLLAVDHDDTRRLHRRRRDCTRRRCCGRSSGRCRCGGGGRCG